MSWTTEVVIGNLQVSQYSFPQSEETGPTLHGCTVDDRTAAKARLTNNLLPSLFSSHHNLEKGKNVS